MNNGSRWRLDHLLICLTLRGRHNDQDGVSNHQPHGCLLNRLFRRRSNKTSKLRVTGLCVGNSPGPVNSPHKGPVTRKMFPFDDVIMIFKPNEYMWHCRLTLLHWLIKQKNRRCILLCVHWSLRYAVSKKNIKHERKMSYYDSPAIENYFGVLLICPGSKYTPGPHQ